MPHRLSTPAGVILLVEDDQDVFISASVLLTRHGWRVVGAASPAEAWSVLASEAIDVILLDLNFQRGATSGNEGLDWLAQLRQQNSNATVVVLTGHSGINIAVQAMKAGAADFIMKPWSNARLLDTVNDAFHQALRRRGSSEPPARSTNAVLLGESSAIRAARERVARAMISDAAVLIHGPAGSGKSLAARTLHAGSTRAQAPLISVDALGFSPDEAAEAVVVAFRQAEGGVLLVEEISALPRSAQSAMLRRLDEHADVRVLSTTRHDPGALSLVRDDLLARLNTITISLPSVAQREADAVLLTEHFVRVCAHRLGCPPKPIDPSAYEFLKGGFLPNEVHGLRQAAERAMALSQGPVLTIADFAPQQDPLSAGSTQADLNLARSERSAIEAALKRHAHNISSASKALGLTRAALYRRMTKYGL